MDAGHIPVLLHECIENLNIRPDGIYKNEPYPWDIREDAAISALPEIFKTDLF